MGKLAVVEIATFQQFYHFGNMRYSRQCFISNPLTSGFIGKVEERGPGVDHADNVASVEAEAFGK